jgi:DNA-binding transcriptional ArsR family regulator
VQATEWPDRSVDDALRAVADPTRRAILRLVRGRELAAGDIATHFPSMSRPAVSQHLRVLADAGLVTVRPEGNRRLYRWRPEGLRDAATFAIGLVRSGAARPPTAISDQLVKLRRVAVPCIRTCAANSA